MKWKKEHKLSHIAKNMNFCNALEKAAHEHDIKSALQEINKTVNYVAYGSPQKTTVSNETVPERFENVVTDRTSAMN